MSKLDSNETLDSLFALASSYVSNTENDQKLSTSIKLELYGLYKLITISPQPPKPRPSFFDQVGRAKWDAWAAAGTSWSSSSGTVNKEAAEKRYIEIATSLGWTVERTKSTNPGVGEKETEKENSSPPNQQDKDSNSPEFSLDRHFSGFGGRVSTMTKPGDVSEDEAELNTFQDYAAEGKLLAIENYLKENPEYNLNSRNPSGYTALHLASDRGHEHLVNYLINAKADATLEDPDGFTAKELAELAGHQEVVRILAGVSLQRELMC